MEAALCPHWKELLKDLFGFAFSGHGASAKMMILVLMEA